MKKKLKFTMMCAALAVLFAFVSTVSAQKVGGYKDAAVDDAGAVAAAEFAVSDHSEKNEVSLEIVKIVKAETQVVAGTNFRLCIEVKVVEEGNPDTQFVQAVVYRNLKKAYKLTSWKPDGCSE